MNKKATLKDITKADKKRQDIKSGKRNMSPKDIQEKANTSPLFRKRIQREMAKAKGMKF